MKLTSLLLGDFADLFQDSRIDEAEASAQVAASTASHNQVQIARLAQTVEQRIREVEQENGVLSLLMVRILRHLAQSQPEETQKIVDEVAAVLRSGVPTSSDLLRKMLDLPVQARTPISSATKPTVVGPRLPQRPRPAAPTKKPGTP